jgi:hypothetical protein
MFSKGPSSDLSHAKNNSGRMCIPQEYSLGVDAEDFLHCMSKWLFRSGKGICRLPEKDVGDDVKLISFNQIIDMLWLFLHQEFF